MTGASTALMIIGRERRMLADSGTSAAKARPLRQTCGSRPKIISEDAPKMEQIEHTEGIPYKRPVRSLCNDFGNLIPKAYLLPMKRIPPPQVVESGLNLVPNCLTQATDLASEIDCDCMIMCRVAHDTNIWEGVVDL